MHAKVFAIMPHAYFSNSKQTVSYESVLNNTLKVNNLPTIKIPSVPDSNKILKTFMPTENEIQRETYENIPEETTRKEAQEEETVIQEKDNQTHTLRGT